jgi:hypothetical protein
VTTVITLSVTVPEAEHTTAAELGELEKQLAQVAIALLAMRRAGRAANLEQLAKVFVGEIGPCPVDITSVALQAQAHRQITTGGPWVTAQELAILAGLSPSSVNRWKATRKILTIQRNGHDYFPLYGLGSDFRPVPAMAQVMAVLPWPGEQLAAWFESTSSFLGGRRPRELLADDPDLVLRAAQDTSDDQTSD